LEAAQQEAAAQQDVQRQRGAVGASGTELASTECTSYNTSGIDPGVLLAGELALRNASNASNDACALLAGGEQAAAAVGAAVAGTQTEAGTAAQRGGDNIRSYLMRFYSEHNAEKVWCACPRAHADH
jgi:hypothetical protein